ncbi:MAG: hypothetical protein RLZZ444_1996 [Pseudomonadota bacterium]
MTMLRDAPVSKGARRFKASMGFQAVAARAHAEAD